MEEKSIKQQMDNYISKCKLLGLHFFDFSYNEGIDKVCIEHIYSEEGQSIKVPPFVSSIEFWAWYDNNDMKKCIIYIPEKCKINFDDVDLKGTFDSFANHVQEIIVQEGHKLYSSKDGVLFDKNKAELLVYPRYKEDSNYTVPSSVIKIKEGAFNYNCNLEQLNIPKNVIEIGKCIFDEKTNIRVNNGNTAYKSVRGSLYSRDGKILYHICVPKSMSIKIEEGTVLIKENFLDGYYDKLFLPSTISTLEGFEYITDEKIATYEVVKAPKRLKKYLKKLEDYSEVYYY